MRYSQETLSLIKSRIRISDLASRHTAVERRGGEPWCRCPIHGEKNASMVLHDDNGTFHCFGCGRSGNVFTLYMAMEHASFPEAVEALAKEAGVQLEAPDPEEILEQKRKDALTDLHDRLAAWCHAILMEDKGEAAENARNYLRLRGITGKTADMLSIGLMPRDLHQFLRSKGYSDGLLASSGLFSARNPTYALMGDRLVFPIRDLDGHTTAFSGRDLSGRARAKYINSGASPIFSKKASLLGFPEAATALRKSGGKTPAIICEGDFDVASLQQAGFPTAVAACGTAFGDTHAQILRRLCDNAICLFDSDAAGDAETLKALVVLKRAGIEPYVCRLRQGKDAAEVLQKYGEDALRHELDATEDAFSHILRGAAPEPAGMSGLEKLEAVRTATPYIEAASSLVERDDLLGRLARTLDVSRTAVRADFARITAGKAHTPHPAPSMAAIPETGPETHILDEKEKASIIRRLGECTSRKDAMDLVDILVRGTATRPRPQTTAKERT